MFQGLKWQQLNRETNHPSRHDSERMGKFEKLCRDCLEAVKPRVYLEENLMQLNQQLSSNEPHALNDSEFESVTRLCIAALNDRQGSYKGRVAVLVFLANLARHDELSARHADVMLGALQGMPPLLMPSTERVHVPLHITRTQFYLTRRFFCSHQV